MHNAHPTMSTFPHVAYNVNPPYTWGHWVCAEKQTNATYAYPLPLDDTHQVETYVRSGWYWAYQKLWLDACTFAKCLMTKTMKIILWSHHIVMWQHCGMVKKMQQK